MDGYTAYNERAITRAYVTRGHVAGLRSTGHRLRQQATFRGCVLFWSCFRIIMASGVGDVIPALTLWFLHHALIPHLSCCKRNNWPKDRAFAWVGIMRRVRVMFQCVPASCLEKIWDEGGLPNSLSLPPGLPYPVPVHSMQRSNWQSRQP